MRPNHHMTDYLHPAADLVDAKRIHELKNLLRRTTGSTIHELIRTFRESVDTSLADLTTASTEHDLSKISKQVHRIKGASLSIGAIRLAHLAERVEEATGEYGSSGFDALLGEFPGLYAETLSALSETRKQIP